MLSLWSCEYVEFDTVEDLERFECGNIQLPKHTLTVSANTRSDAFHMALDILRNKPWGTDIVSEVKEVCIMEKNRYGNDILDVKVANRIARNIKDKMYSSACGIWSDITCYYDNSEYAIRQFVFKASHSWGSAYCQYNKQEILEALKSLGATKIKKARITWNYAYVTFNIKQATYKEYL